MSKLPLWARKTKHALFGNLPGYVGLRNRACLHHLNKKSLEQVFSNTLEKVKSGDVLIDCGANVGGISKRFASTGAIVHSFEPDPWSFNELQSNISGYPNIVLHNQAIGIKDGEISFFRDSEFVDNPVHSSLASSTIRRPGQTQQEIKVSVINFIDFVKQLNRRISILKMDVEGAEVSVLEELFAHGLIQNFDHIFCETHELQFPDLLERTWQLREKAKANLSTSIYLDWH